MAENLLNRPCVAERLHPVGMTDITYIATDDGWLYWASVEDLYSRQIVGWALSERMTPDLVIQAFDQAVARYRPPEGVLHHSDRRSQYVAQAYRDRLTAEHMTASMSRKGNCWDNGVPRRPGPCGPASWLTEDEGRPLRREERKRRSNGRPWSSKLRER